MRLQKPRKETEQAEGQAQWDKIGELGLLDKKPVSAEEKDAYIKELQEALKDQHNEIAELKEMLLWCRKQMFGSKSEKTPVKDKGNEQLGLFNEAEQENATVKDNKIEEPIKKDKRGWHIKGTLGRWEEIKTKNLKVYEKLLELSGEELFCPECGSKLKCIGKEVIREEPEYVKPKLEIRKYIQAGYICPCCKKKGIIRIFKAGVPKPLLNHSMASASVVSEIMYQKYVQAVPLYRQEKQWADNGLAFSRTTMANWVIRCSQDWLSLVYDRMHKELLNREVLHADETPVQVLKERGKTATSKSYMWVYRTGKDGKMPVVLYDYRSGRNGEYPKEFLKGFHGYLHTDGYAGYNKVENITRCGCWAHVRRKFIEAIPANAAGIGGPLSSAEAGRNYCDQLFAAEKKIEELPEENRQAARLESEVPLLRAFWCWLEELNTHTLGGKLKTAVEYALKQRPYLENYLKDPRCQLSNNLAENAIRPFVVGRKNWLFSDSVEGAKASAVVYSLVETAKANHLDPREYIRILLEDLPNMDVHAHPEQADQLLPDSEYIQGRFR